MFDAPEDVLEHFGVKGMRWGVRNENRRNSNTSGEEKKSVTAKIKEHNLKVNTERHNTFKARIEKANIRVSEIQTEMTTVKKYSSKMRDLKYERNITLKQRNSDLKKVQKEPTSGLTVTQKRVLIGAGAAAVIVGFAAAKHYGLDSETVGASIRTHMNERRYGDVFRQNPEFAGKMSVKQVHETVVQGINPNYNNFGGQMNCRRCTFAYELRRRGYDVVATPSALGYGQNDSGLTNALIRGDKNIRTTASLSSFVNPFTSEGIRTRGSDTDTRQHTAFTQSVHRLKDLKAALTQQPSGARGEAVFNMGGFAHSMQWEIFDGVPHIFDSQKGQHFPVTTSGLAALTRKWGTPSVTEITRLDNVDLDTAFLARWAANR